MTKERIAGKRNGLRRATVGPSRTLSLLAIGFAVLVAPDLSLALDFSTTGWVRYRYFYVDNAPLVPIEGRETHSEWLDQRITLNPTLTVNDWAAVKARLDLLSGVVWGKSTADSTFLSEIADATDQVNRYGEEVQSIDLARAWLEVKPAYGLIRVGRQGNQWGLGILANAGDVLEWGLQGNGPEAGDTVDRAAFLTDLARPLRWRDDHLIVQVAYDRPVDPDLATSEDDVNSFVLSALFTNGTVSPRLVGTREAGIYAVYMMQDATDLGAAIVDGYAHLAFGPFYLEGEGVLLFGNGRRDAFVPKTVFDRTERSLVEAAVPVLEKAGVPNPEAIAREAVRGGSPQPVLRDLLVPAYEGALVSQGYAPDQAVNVAGEVGDVGIAGIRADGVDLGGYGVLARGGMRSEWFHAGAEVGVASGQRGGDDIAPVLVGPFGNGPGVGFDAVRGTEWGRVAGAALTGDRSEAFAFDPEYDPALILFQEVGPVNGATGRPGVVDSWYGKGFGEIYLDPRTTIWGAVLYAQLLEKYRPFEVEEPPGCSTCSPIVKVEPPQSHLGVEMDVGVVHEVVPDVRAEVKFGYLFAGAAFGKDVGDIWMVRPQLALEF